MKLKSIALGVSSLLILAACNGAKPISLDDLKARINGLIDHATYYEKVTVKGVYKEENNPEVAINKDYFFDSATDSYSIDFDHEDPDVYDPEVIYYLSFFNGKFILDIFKEDEFKVENAKCTENPYSLEYVDNESKILLKATWPNELFVPSSFCYKNLGSKNNVNDDPEPWADSANVEVTSLEYKGNIYHYNPLVIY